MSIFITFSRAVPDDAFARIQALVHLLQQSDTNFTEVPIEVARGELDDLLWVSDAEDVMRGELLRHLLEEELKSEADSLMGPLRS